MRENGLLAPHRVGCTEAKPHDGTIITDKVNEMWGTDMTQTITIREGRAGIKPLCRFTPSCSNYMTLAINPSLRLPAKKPGRP